MSSVVGTVEEMRELVALALDGKVKTYVGRTGGLDDLPLVLEELEAASYPGRAVFSRSDGHLEQVAVGAE